MDCLHCHLDCCAHLDYITRTNLESTTTRLSQFIRRSFDPHMIYSCRCAHLDYYLHTWIPLSDILWCVLKWMNMLWYVELLCYLIALSTCIWILFLTHLDFFSHIFLICVAVHIWVNLSTYILIAWHIWIKPPFPRISWSL